MLYKCLLAGLLAVTTSPDLASLYQLLAKQEKPVLPSGERRAILGCGYVGEEVARAWKQEGHALWATTTRRERLRELTELVENPLIFDSTDPSTNLDFTADLDGILFPSRPRRVPRLIWASTGKPSSVVCNDSSRRWIDAPATHLCRSSI